MAQDIPAEPRGAGWRAFAGTLILLAGLFNLVDGLVALTNRHFFANPVLWDNLHGWGWVWIAFGALQVLVGLAIFGGSALASMVGIILAVLNALGQLTFLRAYPVWSVVIIAVDLLIIYGLTAWGAARHRS